MKLIIGPTSRLVLLILFAIATAGCEQVSDIASGAGSATKNLADKVTGGGSTDAEKKDEKDELKSEDEDVAEEQDTSQTASGVIGESDSDPDGESVDDEDQESEPEVAATGPRSGDFRLVFEQSYQSCDSCGIWFDSAELVIEHSDGRFSASQSGSLLIKEAPYHQGRFQADIDSIPVSAEIKSATLYMHLNRHEGISNDDFTSTLSVYGYIGGDLTYIREITAEHDIKVKGYSKANPVVPIDFTAYARQI